MKGTRILIAVTIIAITSLLAVPQIVLASDTVSEPIAKLASVAQTNDPCIQQQWSVPKVNSLIVNKTNEEIIIAVLDTGIDTNHEDLAGKVIESVNFSNSKSTGDVNGHGTHIAGIIAADRDNGLGIAGIAANSKLLNVKIAEDNGMVWASNVAKGIIWATDKGARVINMSLAVPSKYQPLEEAVNYAWSHGVVLVAAAGNNVKGNTYPAAYNHVIAVAATTPGGKLWDGSNDGSFVSAYAPGASILSTLPGGKYGALSGTSMASASVSAVVAQAINQVADTNGDGNSDELAALMKTLFPKPAN